MLKDNHEESQNDSENDSEVLVSEMAEMIGMYYSEIKSLAESLEVADSPLPKEDIDNFLRLLIEYSKTGSQLTETFRKKAEEYAEIKSQAAKDNIENDL